MLSAYSQTGTMAYSYRSDISADRPRHSNLSGTSPTLTVHQTPSVRAATGLPHHLTAGYSRRSPTGLRNRSRVVYNSSVTHLWQGWSAASASTGTSTSAATSPTRKYSWVLVRSLIFRYARWCRGSTLRYWSTLLSTPARRLSARQSDCRCLGSQCQSYYCFRQLLGLLSL